MRESPLISFVIPFYGSVRLLKRCLDSLVAQTDGDFEAIVVDDCSPEDGEKLVETFGAQFRYVRQPANLSAFQARNRGVVEARGDYVVPLDPDDYVLPDLVSRLKAAIAASGTDLVIYNVEQDTDTAISSHWCRYEPGMLTAVEALNRMVEKRLQWNVWAKAIRRRVWLDVLEALPSFRSAYMNASEDFCIVVPLTLSSKRISVIEYVGYRYWQNPESICHGVSPKKAMYAILDTLKARRMVLAFAVQYGASVDELACVKRIVRMIVEWWFLECVRDIKRVFFTREVT